MTTTVGKIITMVFIIMALMLLYVHQQIVNLQCSYAINEGEERLVDAIDKNKNLSFQLAALKSPTILEKKLERADINLVLPHEIQIVKVPSHLSGHIPIASMAQQSSQFELFHWLGFDQEAQAELSE